MEEITYVSAYMNAQQLAESVDDIWLALDLDEKFKQEASRHIGSSPVTSSPRDLIKIEKDSDGWDPATTAIVVSFAPVVAEILSDLWTHFILPELLRRKGEDAIEQADD